MSVRDDIAAIGTRKTAADVLNSIVDIADRKGGMTAAQKGFVTTCRRMLRDDHPLQEHLTAWTEARTRA